MAAGTPGDNPIAPPDAAQPAVSDADKAKAAAAAAEARKPSAGPFVRYTGVKWAALTPKDVNFEQSLVDRIARAGTFRKITAQQWGQVGVATSSSHVWSMDNRYKIPASQFNDKQLDYLLDVDGDFELVDASNNRVSR